MWSAILFGAAIGFLISTAIWGPLCWRLIRQEELRQDAWRKALDAAKMQPYRR